MWMVEWFDQKESKQQVGNRPRVNTRAKEREKRNVNQGVTQDSSLSILFFILIFLKVNLNFYSSNHHHHTQLAKCFVDIIRQFSVQSFGKSPHHKCRSEGKRRENDERKTMPDLQCKNRRERSQNAADSPHHRANAEESVTKVGGEHLDRENVEAREGD